MALGGANQAVREQSRIVNCAAGLFVLRYVATTGSAAPVARVAPRRADADSITLLAAPGTVGFTLNGPGECLIVRAERAGALEVTVSARGPRGSLDAELQLERLAAPVSGRAGEDFNLLGPRSVTAVDPEVNVLAHVARRGDVLCKADEWICGPECPIAIEGLEIRWPNKPADVELDLSVVAGGREIRSISGYPVGQFAGTRGRAAPLLGAKLTLTGHGARLYELRADALFLGGPVQSKAGEQIVLSGPTGREAMVGFRLSIVARAAESPRVSGGRRSANLIETRPRGVRVFRSANA